MRPSGWTAGQLQLAVPVASELPDHGNLEDDLIDMTGALAEFIVSSAGMGVLRTVFADGDSPQARRLTALMWSTSAAASPRLVLNRALGRGELRTGVDLDLILYTIAGAVLHRVFVERKAADARWTRRLVQLLFEGCAPSRSGAGPSRNALGSTVGAFREGRFSRTKSGRPTRLRR